MGIQYDISRRHMLAMSAATVAISAMGAHAQAPAAKRIEQFDPALDKIISTSETIKEIASGFGGELGPAEGPVWIKEGGYLLFSDIHNNRRMKYTPGQGVSVFLEPTNRANGLSRDLQGRVVACEQIPAMSCTRPTTCRSPLWSSASPRPSYSHCRCLISTMFATPCPAASSKSRPSITITRGCSAPASS
jgi:hypothetical protein